MGRMVEFPSNGTQGQGYLATPASGSGPGLVVIQEWWGLNDQIKGVADRYASEGFVALVPDLYRGTVVDEPDEAAKMMMSLNLERATKDMVGAVDHLLERSEVTSKTVGVTGYCMGGALALMLATLRPEAVSAVVPYYGVVGWTSAPDYTCMRCAVQGHYAENDDYAGPQAVATLNAELTRCGVEHELFLYEGTHHAFANETNDIHDAEATELAFTRSLAFFREHVG